MRPLTLLLFCGLLFAQVSPEEANYLGVEVLTDTRGVDFTPYVAKVKSSVKENWFARIPESAKGKKGKVVLEFFILKTGDVRGLKIIKSSGDMALDRPAFAGIVGANPFPPLPAEFEGPHLGLRMTFYYNLSIIIAPTLVRVITGASQQFSTTIPESADKTVLWSVGGKGCRGKDCGTISTTGLYTAP